ncbi:hypothetical protein ANCDUO_07955 [Ancylostoma duodenale]|uniref:Uncharacterized protein n=1 Tax=Ancylostoma duodenale TaxID=51022 RepID=A0A0C2DH33_9BILA|nr:hypothetical protein ANCDUO_07955 [Ancylostoma duodenale]
MDWPACWPDCSQVDNFEQYGITVRKIYRNNKQRNTVDDSVVTILEACDQVDDATLQNFGCLSAINQALGIFFYHYFIRNDSTNWQRFAGTSLIFQFCHITDA